MVTNSSCTRKVNCMYVWEKSLSRRVLLPMRKRKEDMIDCY